MGLVCSPGSGVRFSARAALVLRYTKVYHGICNDICKVQYQIFESPNVHGN